MAMKSIHVKFNGISPLLQNNSQTVDVFNKYAKLKKPLTSKRSKTDEDIQALRDIEVESKLYLDDEIGDEVKITVIATGFDTAKDEVINELDNIRNIRSVVDNEYFPPFLKKKLGLNPTGRPVKEPIDDLFAKEENKYDIPTFLRKQAD